MDFLGDLKRSIITMTAVEERAVNIDLCPKCHTRKALKEIFNANGIRTKLCMNCDVVFILEEDPDDLP